MGGGRGKSSVITQKEFHGWKNKRMIKNDRKISVTGNIS